MTISHCSAVRAPASPPIVFDAGFETCNTVQICRYALSMCIRETEFSSISLLQNYVPLNDIFIFTISHFSTVHVSPIFLQYLMQVFETCNTFIRYALNMCIRETDF